MKQNLTESPTGRFYLIWLTLSLILGIFIGLSLPDATNFPLLFRSLLAISSGIILLILMLFRKAPCRRFRPDAILIWLMLLTCFFGIFRVYSFDRLKYRELKASAGVSRQYHGVVIGNPFLSNSGKSYGAPIRILSYQTEAEPQPATGNILLYAPVEFAQNLHRGTTISFTATLSQPSDAPYVGGFSSREYLYRQNYHFQQYVESFSVTQHPYQFTLSERIQFLGESIRESVLCSIDQSFESQSEERALLKGILLGADEDFTLEQYRAFVDSGLIHITSVSGMHVAFLSSFFLFLSKMFRVPKWLISLILVPILFLFTAVAAFTPSVCRATIMMLFLILSDVLQREPSSLTALSASAGFLLLINPYSLISFSFILSFTSTLGLILFAQPIQYYLRKPFRLGKSAKKDESNASFIRRKYLLNPCTASLAMSISCLLGTGFFTMRFFHRISWGSILSNLCLLPISAATFLLGVLNWPLYYLLPSVSKFLAGIPLKFLLWCINRIADLFSHPFFRIETAPPPQSAILPYAVFCLVFYFFLQWDYEK